MKIITCAGYYGTGSSAITDLLGEFENIHYMGDYEFRFIQDPCGIADLEYNLVDNYHRHNSGHALKRFKKNIDLLSGNLFMKRYEAFFHNQFKKLSHEYIDSLTAFRFKGYWHQDVIDKGMLVWYTERILDKILNRLIVPIMRGRKNIEPISIHLLRNEYTYVPYNDPEGFFQKTKEYLDKLFSVANIENKEFIMFDQLLPPSNTQKYCRYFNDIKLISVDRDPRDLFILEKTIWNGGVVPTNNVEDYCRWYQLNREHLESEHDDLTKVLRIQFEDMIYHYDESVNKIVNFLDLDIKGHISPKTKFIPERSIKNTRLWKSHPELETEIKVIESKLSKYCYCRY